MKILLLIGVGSFIGGVSRYLLALGIQTRVLSTFPYGTLGVNVLGGLAIGIVFALSERTTMSPEWRLFLATGICGGFTTFSAFSNETLAMLRDGQFLYVAVYIVASVVLTIVATFIGYSLMKLL